MASQHTPCGIELPQVFFDGPTDMEHIRKFAMRAERLGYDGLWLQERIIGDFTMLEPVTLLSYVAAITTKLKLGTSVILLPLRNPLQLAKAYSTLDVMSGGRAVMGVGLGGGHPLGDQEVGGLAGGRAEPREQSDPVALAGVACVVQVWAGLRLDGSLAGTKPRNPERAAGPEHLHPRGGRQSRVRR